MRRLLLLLVSPCMLAYADCPTWPTTERFELNGAEVADKRTGLVWARCSVGQNWTGSSCSGTASLLNHEAALRHAAVKDGWRVPNVKELASLADRGCSKLAIDRVAFPTTPAGVFWSSSPYVGNYNYAWFVEFGYGSGYNYRPRNEVAYVRLVRSGP